jgi:hypothetical protein
MKQQSGSHRAIKQLIPPLAAWVLGKLLETPKAKGALEEADAYAVIGKRRAMRSVRRLGRNAASNRAWVAAGVAAIAIGIGLMAKATRGK